jgi:hypothetical protein
MRLRLIIGVLGTLFFTLLTWSCEKETIQVHKSPVFSQQKWTVDELVKELSSIMDYVVEHEVRIGQVPDYASTGQVLLPENPIEDAESTVARRLAFLHLQMNEVLSPSTMEAFTQDVRRMSLQKSRKLIDQRSPLRSDGSRIKCLRAHDERGQLAMHGFALCTAKSGGAGWKTCYYVYTTAVIGSFSTLYDCINDLEK